MLYNYKQILKDSYADLKSINPDFKVFSISQIEWWLMKYYDLFKLVIGTYNTLCDNCKLLEDENLPIDCLSKPEYCNKKEEFKSFIGFYNTLDNITQVHRLSDVCYMAYDDYSFMVCVDEDCRDWAIKYHHLWEQLHEFINEYVEEGKSCLSITNISYSSFEVKIYKEDFRIIIAFYNAYYEAYYVKDLYPEKRLEIEKKISR